MSKLYVFGIGGTGARVMKSLTFMLASGVKLSNDIDTVVPILIDPDFGNGDLTRTKQLLDLYMKINKKAQYEEGLFTTKIKTLSELSNSAGSIGDKFKMLDVSGAQNEKFREFIGYSSLSSENKALINLFFSENNLNADMTVGFKGNPNIGSIVLNQFKNSKEYKVFLNSFEPDDSIFIVSSIFGGTGAAGFPLLLRNLRKIDPNLSNSKNVANSKIGALSMMPYFKINTPTDIANQTIDSSSFMGKAKAALSFYSNSIFGNNNQLNSFYTLGEDVANFYEHNDGQAAQKNDAHFLEFAAALAIVDFTWDLQNLETKDEKAVQTSFKEFGIQAALKRRLSFKTLGGKSKKQVLTPMSKLYLMFLFHKHLHQNKKDFEKSPWHIHLEEVYSNDGLYDQYLKDFGEHFLSWIQEMKKNDIAFNPFKSEVSYPKLLNFIEDYEVKKPGLKFWDNPADGDKFNKILNSEYKTSQKTDDKGSDFLKLFDRATEIQVNSITK